MRPVQAGLWLAVHAFRLRPSCLAANPWEAVCTYLVGAKGESERQWLYPARLSPRETSDPAAYLAPLSMGFSRQEYWSGVPLPSPTERTLSANALRRKHTQCSQEQEEDW